MDECNNDTFHGLCLVGGKVNTQAPSSEVPPSSAAINGHSTKAIKKEIPSTEVPSSKDANNDQLSENGENGGNQQIEEDDTELSPGEAGNNNEWLEDGKRHSKIIKKDDKEMTKMRNEETMEETIDMTTGDNTTVATGAGKVADLPRDEIEFTKGASQQITSTPKGTPARTNEDKMEKLRKKLGMRESERNSDLDSSASFDFGFPGNEEHDKQTPRRRAKKIIIKETVPPRKAANKGQSLENEVPANLTAKETENGSPSEQIVKLPASPSKGTAESSDIMEPVHTTADLSTREDGEEEAFTFQEGGDEQMDFDLLVDYEPSAKKMRKEHELEEKARAHAEAERERLTKLVKTFVPNPSDNGLALLIKLNKNLLRTHDVDSQKMERIRLDAAIAHARAKLQESLALENEAEGLSNRKKKQNKETKKIFDEVSARLGEAVDAVRERLVVIDIDKIDYAKNARRPNPLAIVSIQCDILEGIQGQYHMIVKASKNGKRFTVTDGVQRVEAFKALRDAMEQKWPERYQKGARKLATSSQVAEESEEEGDEDESAAKASSQPDPNDHTKERNPFSMIVALVIEDAPESLGPVFCADLRSLQKPKEYPRTCVEKMRTLRRVSKGLSLFHIDDISQTAHKRLLEERGLCVGRHDVRGLHQLDDEREYKLYRVTQEYRQLDKVSFAMAYMKALLVSKYTADEILQQLMDKKITWDVAEKKMIAHNRSVRVLLIGKFVFKKVAEEVEKRLEPGIRTFHVLNKQLQKGKRLGPRAIMGKRETETLLLETERCLTLGYTEAKICQREKNNGMGQEHCIVNFIEYEDFKSRWSVIKDAMPPIFMIFIVGGDKKALSELKLPTGERGVMTYVEAIVDEIFQKATDLRTFVVPAAIFVGEGQKIWSSGEVQKKLDDFKLTNHLDNEEMRRLMYDHEVPKKGVTEKNWYNSVYVHTNCKNIAAIVADMALNRVHTSLTGTELESFGQLLRKLQGYRTKFGQSIKIKNHGEEELSEVVVEEV